MCLWGILGQTFILCLTRRSNCRALSKSAACNLNDAFVELIAKDCRRLILLRTAAFKHMWHTFHKTSKSTLITKIYQLYKAQFWVILLHIFFHICYISIIQWFLFLFLFVCLFLFLSSNNIKKNGFYLSI